MHVTFADYPDGIGEDIGSPAYPPVYRTPGGWSVGIFPNPYDGSNPQETDKYHRFVTLSHLPEVATVQIVRGRLFTDPGIQVNDGTHDILDPRMTAPLRTIYKNDPSQFLRWDLQDEYGRFVQPGGYRAYYFGPTIDGYRWVDIMITSIDLPLLDRF